MPAPERELTTDARRLLDSAFVLWAISLFLPAFTTAKASFLGIEAGISGLLFGFFVNGWAAYANIPFLLTRRLLRKGHHVPLALLIVLPVATLPFFSGVIRDEGSDIVDPVVSWGWGAVIWVFSLLLTAMAALVSGEVLGKRSLVGFFVVSSLAIVGLVGLHSIQSRAANAQERSSQISPQIAFTFAKSCGIPFVLPARALVPPNESVVLQVSDEDLEIRTMGPNLSLPKLPRLHTDNTVWSTSNFWSSGDTFDMLLPAAASRYVVTAKRTPLGALIRLEDREKNLILYEQALKTTRNAGNREHFCPGSRQFHEPPAGALGYDDALAIALGARQAHTPQAQLLAEVAETPCDVGVEPVPQFEGARQWDGRTVILNPAELANRAGRCSEHYVMLVSLERVSSRTENDFSPTVDILDRKTLKPVARYRGRWCPGQANSCDIMPRDDILRVCVQPGEAIVVETTLGVFKVGLRRAQSANQPMPSSNCLSSYAQLP